MLYSFFITNNFKRAAQSGFYIDFFLKNVFEILVRNTLIYTAQFFCEKYIIEHFTKKIFVNIIYIFNQFNKSTNFNFNFFFLQLIILIFYIGFFINLILLIL